MEVRLFSMFNWSLSLVFKTVALGLPRIRYGAGSLRKGDDSLCEKYCPFLLKGDLEGISRGRRVGIDEILYLTTNPEAGQTLG